MNWSRDCGEFGGFSIDLLPGGVGQLRGYDGCAVEAVTVGHVHERDLVDIALSEALAPMPRDLGTCGAPVPDVRDKQWSEFPGQVTAMLHDTDGTAQGR